MARTMETYNYTFGEIVMQGRRAQGRDHTTWYIECPECGGQHCFRKLGRKIWVTNCVLFDVEWTITPVEYYVKKPTDFTRILGDI